MKPCPVVECGGLIKDDILVCQEDWRRLPLWARDDLLALRRMEPGSKLCQRAVAVALAYLDEKALEVAAG